MLKEGLSKLQLPLSKIGRKGSTTESPKEKTSPRSSERSLNQSGENVKGSQLSREGTVRSPRRAERGGGFAGLLSPKNKSETSGNVFAESPHNIRSAFSLVSLISVSSKTKTRTFHQ